MIEHNAPRFRVDPVTSEPVVIERDLAADYWRAAKKRGLFERLSKKYTRKFWGLHQTCVQIPQFRPRKYAARSVFAS